MKRLFWIVISLLMLIPAYAGQYEDALRSGEPVLLYMYTQHCGYCKKFNPIFEKTFQKYKKSCRFVKVNAESPYGYLLVRDLRVNYVPFVILADSKRQYVTSIAPSCLLEDACLENELKNFLK